MLHEFAVACAAFAGAGTDEGQGPADPSARIEEYGLGTHWFGPELTHDDLIGKVVLIETWGS